MNRRQNINPFALIGEVKRRYQSDPLSKAAFNDARDKLGEEVLTRLMDDSARFPLDQVMERI